MKASSDEKNSVLITYKASHLSENARKGMDDLDYGTKAFDQLSMFFSVVSERSLALQK